MWIQEKTLQRSYRVETYLTGSVNLNDHFPGIPCVSSENGKPKENAPTDLFVKVTIKDWGGVEAIFQQRSELPATHSDLIETSFKWSLPHTGSISLRERVILKSTKRELRLPPLTGIRPCTRNYWLTIPTFIKMPGYPIQISTEDGFQPGNPRLSNSHTVLLTEGR